MYDDVTSRISNKLRDVAISHWKREDDRVYTDIQDIRFYISSRPPREGESSEGDVGIPVERKYMILEIVDLSSQRTIEHIENKDDGSLLSLYNQVIKGLARISAEDEDQRRKREISEGEEKLLRILRS